MSKRSEEIKARVEMLARANVPPTEDRVDLSWCLRRIERLEGALRGFLDYYEPRGGVSDVPQGPFERGRAALSDEEE